MQKAKVFDIAGSNIELLGSEIEEKLKLSSAQCEKAWKGAGEKVGHWIWRIENFKVVKQHYRSDEPAKFYMDDSYIVLNTYKAKDSDALLHDVHFWLGETTSQDEMGTAAYKTVELDTLLGDKPVQHREVCHFESKLFLSYYNGENKAGIMLLEGGVASGFNHVEPEKYEPRLLHLKGKKHIRVTQVPMKVESMSCDDVFILDAGKDIYQWQGKKAGKDEIAHAGRMCQALDDQRKGLPEKHVFRQGDKDEGEFWKAMGVDTVPEVSNESGGDVEWMQNDTKSMHQLSDESGELQFTECKGVKKDNLDSKDVFIIDIGSKVIVWIGKGASEAEKKKGMLFASKYLAKHDRPLHLPVCSILEGTDCPELDASWE